MAKVELDAKELADLCTALKLHIRNIKNIFGTTDLGKALTDDLKQILMKLNKALDVEFQEADIRRKHRKEISEHIT